MIKDRLFCKKCGEPRNLGRRLCKKCNSKRVASLGRYKWNKKCLACGNIYLAINKEQKFCSDCYRLRKKISKENVTTNKYVYVKSINRQQKESFWEHKSIVEKITGRELSQNEVIHHLDGNPANNSINNLFVLSRIDHGKLHNYLLNQRVIWEKSQNKNSVNCWDNLRVAYTTAWLEMTGAKVLKISELVNQHPISVTEQVQRLDTERLKDKSYGEGIVQTTTQGL